MAIGISPLFNSLSGTTGPINYRTRRNGKIEIGKKRNPSNPQSEQQINTRNAYGRLSELWKTATWIDKTQYERLGNLYNISAWNAFLMRHLSNMSLNPAASYGYVENSENTLHDLTENKNHGTIYGAYWDTTGKADLQALNCDGIDDEVSLGTHQSLNSTKYGLSTWIITSIIAPATKLGFRLITIHKLNGSTRISLALTGPNIALFYNDGINFIDYTTANKIYYDGNPHQIFGTYDGTTFKLYFDGIKVTSRTDILSSEFNNVSLFNYLSVSGFYTGLSLSNNIYTYAPTEDQILQNFNNTKKLYGVL